MDKHEVIRRLCSLLTKVNGIVFEYDRESDCFCDLGNGKQFSSVNEGVVSFVEEAVAEKIANDKKAGK